MKFVHLAAALCALALPGSASAQTVTMDTVYSACFIHFGDQKKPTEVTPVMKVSAPILPPGSTYSQTAMMLDGSYTQVLNRAGVRRYKAQCLSGTSVAEVARKLKNWESISGYGSGPKVQVAANTVWPALLDQMFGAAGSYKQVIRSMYSAQEVGKAF